MINISRAMKSNRVLKSLTGLNIEKFQELTTYFELLLNEEFAKQSKSKKRQRAIGGGRRHTLQTAQEKLFFILFYVKVYPTFDMAGFIFNVNRSQTNRWTHTLLPLLEKALERRVVLPKRQIQSMEEFMKLFPEVKDIFIDATEQRVQRPKVNTKQRRLYSGKKKLIREKQL
ncbi:hypothetical protein MNB_SM-7-745 [hydrothermal vent metagenome]|uniref:Transposase Helix-turn-helix domain-containing protein n=1 Tax=hydrothermal vent metagenome TaxID=652676 RepID=A0A1W1C3Q5_9ZZZZ